MTEQLISCSRSKSITLRARIILVNRTAIHVLSQNHRIRDKMPHACTSRGTTCTAKQGRIVQTQNFIFGRFSNYFFYPNGTWTHPPTSKLFLDFLNFFNFAKPLIGTKCGTHVRIHLGMDKDSRLKIIRSTL